MLYAIIAAMICRKYYIYLLRPSINNVVTMNITLVV